MLLTKLRAPRAAVNDVVRLRLLEEVERGADRKLTLIVTPPGYGKSTLLSRWQSRTERASGWLSLDAADNDSLVFMEYLIGAIQSIDPCICQETASMLDAPSPPPAQQLIHSVLNEIAESTRPFVLILDDYHVISSLEVRSAVLQIIQGMPVNMAIVISSRQEPDLPTLKMSARGELVELGPEDLSFTNSETAEFLLVRQELELTAGEVEEITRWAEGWPVALRLISRVLRGRSHDQVRDLLEALSDNVPSIGDYLWDEVLEDRPPDQRAFLLQTSILHQFNPELAAAVTGNQVSAALLSNLARDNLFISRLDGPGNWYRYHHLFAEVLRQRLLEDTSETSLLELHTRAANWYEEHGHINEAAKHAILAGNWEHATRYLVTICREFHDQERVVSLRIWLGNLPEEPFVQAPKLAYWLAWALMRSGHARQAARPIELASSALAVPDNLASRQTELQFKVLRSIYEWDAAAGQAAAKALLDMLGSDVAADRVRTRIMLALLQETEGKLADAGESLEAARVLNERIAVRGLQVLELNATGGLLLAMGKLKEPADLFRRVIAIGDEWNDLPVQNAHHQLGSILLEWNRLEDARAHALAAIDLSKKMDTPIHLPSAHALLAALAKVDERWDVALDEIERSIAFCAAAEAWGPLSVFEEMQCRLWLATNQLTLAQRWLQQVGPSVLESARYEELKTTLTAIRVRIHEGRAHEVTNRLDHLRMLAHRHGWNRELVTIQTLRGIAECERGDLDAARSAIDEALEVGAPEGFLRSYLDEGPRALPVLKLAAREDGPHRNHAIAVLATAGESVPPLRSPAAEAPSILSTRERDVMRLVAGGLSNRAIGDTLFISEETVKTHLRRIFEKLEVSSRTQAVHKAQQLGLV